MKRKRGVLSNIHNVHTKPMPPQKGCNIGDGNRGGWGDERIYFD